MSPANTGIITALWPLVLVAIIAWPLVQVSRRRSPRMGGFAPDFVEVPARRSPLRVRTLLAILFFVGFVPLATGFVAPDLTDPVLLFSILVLLATALLMSWHARKTNDALMRIVNLDPRLAVAYSGLSGLHVGMWSLWFERSGIPWYVTVPNDDVFDKVRMHYPQTPVVVGGLSQSVRAAFYPHGAKANERYLKAHPNVTHVFLGHGDSDKPGSSSDRVLDFDIVTVAGQAAVDRFIEAGVTIPADRIRIIGRPQTEGIVTESETATSPATVLFAPTWWHVDEAENLSSMPYAKVLIETLIERGHTIVFRRHFARHSTVHPENEAMIEWIDERLQADAAATGRAHRWGLEPRLATIPDLFNSVDALLSDVSSMVVDFMASDKPLLLCASGYDDPEEFRATHPSAKGAYLVSRTLEELEPVLDDMFGADSMREVRIAQADYFLGGPERHQPAERFLALLTELGG